MADENNAKRDGNHVTSMLFVGSDGLTYNAEGDESTGRLKVDLAGGVGTVTSVSVVSANGFAGTVATATSTPAITLSTTVNAPVLAGNGTAIAAATTTGSGSTVVLATSPTLVTPILGVATATSINGLTISATTGTLTLANGSTLVTAGANSITLTSTGATNVTLPTTGTLMANPMTTGGDIIYGGASGDPTRLANGTAGQVLTSNGTTLAPSWEDAAGGSGITVGTTTITSGTNTRILYNNAGVVGEYTLTGSGTVVAMQTAPTFVTSITTPSVLATANDSGALGASGTAFSDLFLASGGVINWAAGDYTLTHATGILTANKDLRITTVGTDAASVPTLGSTSTLTNKTLTNPTINAAVITGDFQVDATPNTDDTWNGQSTNTFNAGATIAQFDCVYLSSSSTWLLTDADAASTAGGVMVAMAGAAGTNGNALRVILPGAFVRNDAWNWTPGAPLYLDTATPGGMTATAPSGTDDVVRIVAYAVTADVIFFNPSNDWITRT